MTSLTPVGDYLRGRYPRNDGTTHYLGGNEDPGCSAGPHPLCTYNNGWREGLKEFAYELHLTGQADISLRAYEKAKTPEQRVAVTHPDLHVCMWCLLMRERSHFNAAGEYVDVLTAHRTCENNVCCIPGCQERCACDHAGEAAS